MVTKPIKEKYHADPKQSAEILCKLLGKGLSQRIMSVLGVIQGTDRVGYYTAADIAFAMVDRGYPTLLLDGKDFHRLTNHIVNRLLQEIKRSDRCSRTPARQGVSEEVHRYYSNVKTAYGYRIGKCIVPLTNADMAAESKILRRAVDQVQKNPLPHAKELADMLSNEELTELIMYAVTLKDKKYLEKLHTESALRQRLRIGEMT